MKWVTRAHVKVDRVACPWLIAKFIDPSAEFLFLPENTDWGGSEMELSMTCLAAGSLITTRMCSSGVLGSVEALRCELPRAGRLTGAVQRAHPHVPLL